MHVVMPNHVHALVEPIGNHSEYLPALIGRVLGPYQGYNPLVNSQVTQEFSTAAFRMGHSQVSDTQEGIDAEGNVVFAESLAQSFFNTPGIDESNGIDPLIRSLGVDYSQATDVYVVSALRNLLVAGLVGGGVDLLDLIAIDIQREKDVGRGTLNQTRIALGFRPYQTLAQLTSDPVLAQKLLTTYTSIDQVDLFIGGLAEKHAPGRTSVRSSKPLLPTSSKSCAFRSLRSPIYVSPQSKLGSQGNNGLAVLS